MSIQMILIVVLLLLFIGGLPTWGYHSYGWYPSSGLGIVLLILLVLLILGKL